ncbi:DNA-binding protein [Solwaraspora sp. WMMD406]|uniref:DNA-binding protein n=1 Tax=Solwaraspora sp. WMMD406 TaxID=3016095 RepID=UPI0024165A14|nr:DNA-binding protein [Solwaraspora sp. WMMD406]MDG4767345.1 DNA-binding protein [Solwaraspora sp. WMMD406]
MTVDDPFTPPDAARSRAHRAHAALLRIAERHADTSSRRHRHLHPEVVDPYEAIRLVLALAVGGATSEAGEPALDQSDLVAALTLVAPVRADLDAIELGLLEAARQRGLTWQAIAFGLGLGTAQAARQRYERISGRSLPRTTSGTQQTPETSGVDQTGTA